MRPQLDRLLKDEKPIYVRNQTNPRGQIVITFHDTASGKTIAVHIPRTTLPWCVSDYVPSTVIDASHDFRRFITKGIVELLDPADAQEELQGEDAKEEMAELNASSRSHGLSPYSNLAKKAKVEDEDAMKFEGMTDEFGGTQTQVGAVAPRVMSTIINVDSKTMGVRQAMRELRGMEDQLTEEDLAYILSESKRGGKIHEYASKKLAEIRVSTLKKREENSTTTMATSAMADAGAPKPKK